MSIDTPTGAALRAALHELALPAERSVSGDDAVSRFAARLDEAATLTDVSFDEPAAGAPHRPSRRLLSVAAAVIVLAAVATSTYVSTTSVPEPAAAPGDSYPWMVVFDDLPDGLAAQPDAQIVDARFLTVALFSTGAYTVGYRISGPSEAPGISVEITPASFLWGANTTVRRGSREVPAIFEVDGTQTLRWTEPSGVNVTVIGVIGTDVNEDSLKLVARSMRQTDRREWESSLAGSPSAGGAASDRVVAQGTDDGVRWMRIERADRADRDDLFVEWRGAAYRVSASLGVGTAGVFGSDLAGAAAIIVPKFATGCARFDEEQPIAEELPELPPEAEAPPHLYLTVRDDELEQRRQPGIALSEAGWMRTEDGRTSPQPPDLTGHCVAQGGRWSAGYPEKPDPSGSGRMIPPGG